MDDDSFEDFGADLRTAVRAMLADRLDDVQKREDLMFLRFEGMNTAGMSFPTSSFSVTVVQGRFHLNIPSSIADAATVEAVKAAVADAGERHGVELDVDKDVRGGSNYVLEGRLTARPGLTPGM